MGYNIIYYRTCSRNIRQSYYSKKEYYLSGRIDSSAFLFNNHGIHYLVKVKLDSINIAKNDSDKYYNCILSTKDSIMYSVVSYPNDISRKGLRIIIDSKLHNIRFSDGVKKNILFFKDDDEHLSKYFRKGYVKL